MENCRQLAKAWICSPSVSGSPPHRTFYRELALPPDWLLSSLQCAKKHQRKKGEGIPGSQARSRGKDITVKKHLQEVITVRTFKEYVEESLLIVFSVVLALFLTMLFQKLHEDSQMREVIHELREELISNKKAEEVQLRYHLQVLKNIDSALADPAMAQQFINNGALNLKIIAPEGVLNRDLNDVVWQVARQNNVFARLDLSTYSLLNTIYDNQQRIMKSESEVAKVLESWDSRKPENLMTTLILLKDNYLGWAVERAPALLTKYQEAIDKLSNY
jgi:hypothetical protein